MAIRFWDARCRNKPGQGHGQNERRDLLLLNFGIQRLCCTCSNLSNETKRNTNEKSVETNKKKGHPKPVAASALALSRTFAPTVRVAFLATIEWLHRTKAQKIDKCLTTGRYSLYILYYYVKTILYNNTNSNEGLLIVTLQVPLHF